MTERHQLAVGGQPFQRTTLENGIVVAQIIENAGFEDKKSAINPALVQLGLFRKPANPAVPQLESAESRRRALRWPMPKG